MASAMDTQSTPHPSVVHLAALALGKLKPELAAKVQSHLDDCPECQRYLSGTPRNELAEVIKQARPQKTIEPDTSGANAGQATVTMVRATGSARNTGSTSSQLQSRIAHSLGASEIPPDLYAQSKYRIVGVLGRGGMGTVYEAEHVRMKRPVAIKVINPERVDNPQALLRFEDEIKAVASLDHGNIARAYDAETIGGLQVFVMEFVRGQTVNTFLKSRGRLSVVDACRCVRQALIGLQHAHEHGLVHRDLKPQNLMLTRDTGHIKILDFGLAKAVSENRPSQELTQSRATMGTYGYMAPEQALDAAKADIRADIYSLGCTLYLLISGELPFAYESDAHLLLAHQNESPRPLRSICPNVPEALSDLVARMLAKNPADRPQTPREAADALLPFARGKSNIALPLAAGQKVNRRMRFAIAAALIALLGFGAWAMGLLPFGSSRPKDLSHKQLQLTSSEPPQASRVPKPPPSDTAQSSAQQQTVRPAAMSHAPLNRRGNWRIDNGELIVTSTEQQSVINFGDLDWTDYDFSYKTCRAEGVSVLGGKFHQSAAGIWGNFALGIFPAHNGWRMGFQNPEQPESLRRGVQRGQLSIVLDRWYDVKIKCRGTDFSASVDGKVLVENSRHINATKGAVGLWASGPGEVRFKDVKVTAPEGRLLWEGLPDPKLTRNSVTSDILPDLTDKNSQSTTKDTE